MWEQTSLWSRSHHQDGHLHMYCKKNFQNHLWNQKANNFVTWYAVLRMSAQPRLLNDDPRLLTLAHFSKHLGRSNFIPISFKWE